uniref:Integrin alpha FG-GAP repeat containing 1 n=1 Tax=Cyclopterus lumpus TaxID=8103 RepID=A0A8C2ZEL9_CYCLU
MLKAFRCNILAFVLFSVGPDSASALQDVTAELFGAENYGTVAAFGDFYADKQTDMFIIRGQSELVIFLADSKTPYFKPKINITKDIFPRDTVLTSVVPGDYDGDSQMDVLLTAQLHKSKMTTVFIFWGNNQTLDMSQWLMLNKTFTDQPLVMDFNGDMIPDIFGVTDSAPPLYTEVSFKSRCRPKALNSSVNMRIPHSNAFIDLNKDLTTPVLYFIVSHLPLSPFFFSLEELMPSEPPAKAKVVGQSSFVDFDGDGYQDHLLPVCLDDTCHHSAIYMAKSGSKEWVPVLLDFQWRETIWSFDLKKLSPPVALHFGDYNLDGFPDALVVLHNTSGSGQQAFLLENVPCNNASCHSVGRMFYIHWDQADLGAIQNAVIATFFDIYEDGILDMLVLSQAEGKSDLIIHALKNNYEADAYFVKVMGNGLSGLCFNNCPDNIKPFGVNQPGPYVMYTTTDSNGNLKNASAGQLSQSAHFSLQLPYTVLGLGRSANFLDHLFVGIPRPSGETEIRKKEWTAIIPNSQLIVIPFPNNQPRSWSAKLYLTPSNSVLLTAVALIGVCVFILGIIGILHWREKKADDREKRQEAHRFHFDAM